MNPYIYLSLKGIYRFLTNSNERELFKLSLFTCKKKRYEENNIKFLDYRFIVPDCQSFIWQFKEIFVEEFYRFESVNKSPFILDCGANIGTSCIFFKRFYPESRIVAFEANPKIAQILKKNLKENNFGDIEILEKAVWINEDGIELGIEDADASSIYKKENKVKIDSIRLKNILEKFEQVDMLKMDIEGAEFEVIKDCNESLSKVKNLFIEYHSFVNEQQNLSGVLSILEKNNFRYFIKSQDERTKPLINRKNKTNPDMDLQLNIFAYKE